jgi:hypothetical protein
MAEGAVAPPTSESAAGKQHLNTEEKRKHGKVRGRDEVYRERLFQALRTGIAASARFKDQSLLYEAFARPPQGGRRLIESGQGEGRTGLGHILTSYAGRKSRETRSPWAFFLYPSVERKKLWKNESPVENSCFRLQLPCDLFEFRPTQISAFDSLAGVFVLKRAKLQTKRFVFTCHAKLSAPFKELIPSCN